MKVFVLVGIASLTSFSAWASCKAPPAPPPPPSGVSATREQMLEAQSAVKGYDAAVVVYADCLRNSGGADTEINAAVAQLEKIAERFNAELRAFKQKNGAK